MNEEKVIREIEEFEKIETLEEPKTFKVLKAGYIAGRDILYAGALAHVFKLSIGDLLVLTGFWMIIAVVAIVALVSLWITPRKDGDK